VQRYSAIHLRPVGLLASFFCKGGLSRKAKPSDLLINLSLFPSLNAIEKPATSRVPRCLLFNSASLYVSHENDG
jgi:hypothetical protein